MNNLFENEKYRVNGEVALSECMNLKPLMNYIAKVDDTIVAIGEQWVPAGCTNIEDAIKLAYKTIYDTLHDSMVKDNGNASALKAQENTFRQAILFYLCRVTGSNVKIKLCTVLDENDPMRPKDGLLKSFKLFNSVNVVEPTCAEYECIVSTSEFELNVEFV